MSAHCTSSKLEFARFFNRQVTARFDGGRMSSDGGAIVLREVEQTLNLFERLTQCFTDYHNPGRLRTPDLGVAGATYLRNCAGL